MGDAGFLTDRAIWTRVEGIGDVPLFAARIAPDPFPKRVWSSCGEGCRETPSVLPVAGALPASALVSGAREQAGDLVVFIVSSVAPGKGAPVMSVAETVRLSDGGTLAAFTLHDEAHFGFALPGDDSPFAPIVSASGKGLLFGMTDPATWATTWRPGFTQTTAPNIPVAKFVMGDAIGFSWYDGRVARYPLTGGAPTMLDDSAATAYSATARGGLAAWVKWNGTDRDEVFVFSQQDGLQSVFARAGTQLHGVRLTDDRLVWIGVTSAADGGAASGRFFYSPKATRLEGIRLTEGPAFPRAEVVTDLVAGGGYAATLGCRREGETSDTTRCDLYATDLASGRLWAVPPRVGTSYQRLYAISSTVIFLAEMDWPITNALYPQAVQRFVQLDTASLDALARGR